MKKSWPKKWSLRRLMPILFGLLLLGAIVWGFWPRPVPVDTAPTTRGLLQVTVEEDGKTRIKDRYVVSAPVAGLMQRIMLDPGDTVMSGKTLLATIEPNIPAVLDPRDKAQAEAKVKAAKAAQKKTEANLALAKTNHDHARSELKRVQKLAGKQAASIKEFEEAEHQVHVTAEEIKAAEFAVKIAEFEVEIAEAALRTVEQISDSAQVDLFHILSPISGRVLRVFQKDAASIPAGKQLVEVGDPTDLEVEIDVLSSDAVKIQPGSKVYLDHWGGPYPLLGIVRLVEPAAFLKVSALGVEEQRVNVIVDLLDPLEKRKTLGDAYRVEARIVIWEDSDVLKIPAGALFRHGEGWAVFRVVNEQAQLQPVQVGRSNGLETQILQGLAEGDPVIVHPSDKVRDGAAVTLR